MTEENMLALADAREARFEHLAEQIERVPAAQFNMSTFLEVRGEDRRFSSTQIRERSEEFGRRVYGCIAGWAFMLNLDVKNASAWALGHWLECGSLADRLILPNSDDAIWRDAPGQVRRINPEHAARAIRRLRDELAPQ
ncbi:MAG: hypothetical protein AAFW46_14300 [Pseudomonadota bacterium]